jgi:hypothetical protein
MFLGVTTAHSFEVSDARVTVKHVGKCFAVQTYTYDIKPIKDNSRPSEQKLVLLGSTASSEGPVGGTTTSTAESSDNIHSYEVESVVGVDVSLCHTLHACHPLKTMATVTVVG